MLSKILYFELVYGLHLLGAIIIYPLLILIGLVDKIFKELKHIVARKQICGQVAVVTGSGRGLGRDIAKELASRGCHIAIVDIQENLALETAQYINEIYGVKTKAYKVDVRNYDQLLQLRDSVTSDLGTPTIPINNAGIILSSTHKNPPPQEIKQMIDVNFTALCYTLQIFLPKMMELNQGYIVNISSASALQTMPILNIYAATKAAVRSLSSALRMECLLERKNITTTTVMPTILTTNKRAENAANLFGIQYILPLVDGEIVAKYAINGMLKGSREVSVPSVLLYLHQLVAILPVHIVELLIYLILSSNHKKLNKDSTKVAEVLKNRDIKELINE